MRDCNHKPQPKPPLLSSCTICPVVFIRVTDPCWRATSQLSGNLDEVRRNEILPSLAETSSVAADGAGESLRTSG